MSRNPGKHSDWTTIRDEIDAWVLRRKGLYAAMLTFVLATLITAYRTWASEAKPLEHKGLRGEVADVLDYLLPEFFEALVDLVVIQCPSILAASALLVAIYVMIRRYCRNRTVEACERLRNLVIHEND